MAPRSTQSLPGLWITSSLLFAMYHLLLPMTPGAGAWGVLTAAEGKAGQSDLQQPMDCFTANRTCFDQNNPACRNTIMILYRVCGRSWKYCESENIKYCRSHLKSVRVNTVFHGCVCYSSHPQQDRCNNLWKLLHDNPCERSPVPKRPAGKAAVDVFVDPNGIYTNSESEKKETRYQHIETNPAVTVDRGEGPSCLSVQEECDESPRCQVLRTDFVNKCRLSQCERNSDDCLNTYESIRLFSVFKCTCMNVPERSQLACKVFRSQFVENQCLALMNRQTLYGPNYQKSSGSNPKQPDRPPGQPRPQPSPEPKPVEPPTDFFQPPPPPPRKPEVEPPARKKPPPPLPPRAANGATAGGTMKEKESPEKTVTISQPKVESCFVVYQDCVRMSSCLERMLRIVEFCQRRSKVSPTCPDREQCFAALQDFYSNMALHTFALRALSCNCHLTDRDCMAKLDMFRPACAYQEHHGTCLSLVSECYRDVTCVPHFSRFQASCLDNNKERVCKYSPRECLDAYRTIWGTNLTQRCSCDPALIPASVRNNRLKLSRYLMTCQRLKELLEKMPCMRGMYKVGYALASMRVQPGTSKSNSMTAKQRLAQRNRAACRERKGPGVQEARIRLYHNDSCSDLCQCVARGVASCRVLPCSNTQPCRQPHNPECTCVFGYWLCPPASTRWHRTSNVERGLFLHASYSPGERRLLQQHQPPADLGNLSHTLTWILNSSTGGISRLCQLHLEEEMPTSVVYRVSLVDADSSTAFVSDDVELACRYPIRLLQLMIESGDPAIRTHPQLSLLRRATVLDARARSAASTAKPGYSPLLLLLLLLLTSVLLLPPRCASQ